MPASKALQQRAIAVKRLTGSNDVKASQKAIYKAISNYEWNNEKDFSDNDLDRYPLLLEGNEYESDQLMVRWKVFKITDQSVMVVRTYMAQALNEYRSYSFGNAILYTMNPNHKGLNDLLQDLIDLDWYHKLHFPVKVMAKHVCNLITYRRYMVGEIWQHQTYFSLELTRNGELYDYDIQDLNLKVLRFRSLGDLVKYSKYIIGKDVKIDHSI